MEFLEFKLNGQITLIAKDAIRLVSVMPTDDNENSKCMIVIGNETVDFVGTTDEVMEFYNNFHNILETTCKITQIEKEQKPAYRNGLPDLDKCVLIVEENHDDIRNS